MWQVKGILSTVHPLINNASSIKLIPNPPFNANRKRIVVFGIHAFFVRQVHHEINELLENWFLRQTTYRKSERTPFSMRSFSHLFVLFSESSVQPVDRLYDPKHLALSSTQRHRQKSGHIVVQVGCLRDLRQKTFIDAILARHYEHKAPRQAM